jgi:3alpha(or 20beta)-hydroxysteroid dehydrogenase
MGKLDGKVAIITGAASGIGAAQASLLAAEGAAVVLADISPEGEKVAAEIGGNAIFVSHDVTRQESWTNLVETAERQFGRIDILVNTAGISRSGSIDDITVEMFMSVFQVNTLGVFLGTKAVVGPMTRAGGGAIVNIASAAAFHGYPGTHAYSASKWAVRGLTKTTAKELASRKIRVNAIFPGPISTKLLIGRGHDPDAVARVVTAVGYAGAPEDIAAATLYLVSEDARYVYGAELAVDGGQAI